MDNRDRNEEPDGYFGIEKRYFTEEQWAQAPIVEKRIDETMAKLAISEEAYIALILSGY